MATATKTAKAVAAHERRGSQSKNRQRSGKSGFQILDRAGAKKMTHQEIANYLHTKHSVPPWWTQMVTVTYEQQRGLRDKHQRPTVIKSVLAGPSMRH